MPTAVRFKGAVMTRATPTIVNLGYNSILMWDGRMPTLEKQGVGGQGPKADINAGSTEAEVAQVVDRIKSVKGYQDMFAAAYPGEPVTKETIGKAVAAFERSVVSNTSAFDRWLKGDVAALSAEQVRGFAVFVDPGRGNCAVCHAAPNFTDNGFHNVGLASFGSEKPDVGRFAHKPVARMKGAFKTPTLRDVSMTAPYFHDGSASTLPAVVEHYAKGGENQTNLSPNMKPLALTQQDKEDLVAFMKALTSPYPVFDYPVLPK
jgi:cytochrome c peroxidase